MALQKLKGKFTFQASWKDTYIHTDAEGTAQFLPSESGSVDAQACKAGALQPDETKGAAYAGRVRRETRLLVKNFFSDVLYQGHLCATHPISPHWLAGDNLPRRDSLGAEQFRRDFERPGIPVVMKAGQSFASACSRWTAEYLLQQLRGRSIIAGVPPCSFDGCLEMAVFVVC